MRISGGHDLRGGAWTGVDEVNVEAGAVASVTFSGLDGTGHLVYAIYFHWLHAGTGVKRLDLRINGSSAPVGSFMVRNQMERLLGLREDRVDPDMTAADLVAAAANTFVTGVLYVNAELDNNDNVVHGHPLGAESFAHDATLLLGDRERVAWRQGIWVSDFEDNVTSLSLTCSGGTSSIANGSFFKLFRAT